MNEAKEGKVGKEDESGGRESPTRGTGRHDNYSGTRPESNGTKSKP